MTTLTAAEMHSPLGPLHLLFHGEELLYTGFADPRSPEVRIPAALRRYIAGARVNGPEDTVSGKAVTSVEEAKRQLEAYFHGEAVRFELPLRLYGSTFQMSVWNYLLSIESGGTRTYGQVAAGSGYSRAVRAAGSAVGSNPIAVIVPCHRILPASGGIGNYGGGADRKEFLLRLERAAF